MIFNPTAVQPQGAYGTRPPKHKPISQVISQIRCGRSSKTTLNAKIEYKVIFSIRSNLYYAIFRTKVIKSNEIHKLNDVFSAKNDEKLQRNKINFTSTTGLCIIIVSVSQSFKPLYVRKEK